MVDHWASNLFLLFSHVQMVLYFILFVRSTRWKTFQPSLFCRYRLGPCIYSDTVLSKTYIFDGIS